LKEHFSKEEIKEYIEKVESDEEFANENAISDDYKEELEVEAEEIIFEDFSEAIIKKEDGKFYVYDESGNKRLGGPYDSRDQAIKRLRQIEFFKKTKGTTEAILVYKEEQVDAIIERMISEEELTEAGDTYHNKLSPSSPHNKNHRKIPKKCRKCGSTKNIDLHHPSGDRRNLNSTKGIIPLCRTCHRKLHQGKGKSKADIELIRGMFNKLFTEFKEKIDIEVFDFKEDPESEPDAKLTISEIEFLDEENVDEHALAKANLKKQKDLMYVAFKLVHAGINKNKDFFKEEELQAAEDTPRLKGVNWQHSNLNIGVIYDSKFVPSTEEEMAHIVCAAAIWKYKFPEYAKEMRSRYTEGNLKFSMEVWFDEAECSTCRKIFPAKGEYCHHLQSRYNNETSRILVNLNFGGTGIVEQPADEDADALAIASKNKKIERSENRMEELQKELDLAKAKIEALNTEINTLKTDLAEANNAKKTAEDAKAQIEAQANEIQKTSDEYKTKLDEIENDKKAEAIASDRYEKLEKLGVAVARDDEDYTEFYNNLKTMSDDAFNAMVKAAAMLAKKMPKVEENAEAKDKEKEEEVEEAKAAVIPVGDTEVEDNKDANYPWLVKALGADMQDLT
jgi:hypothetical protein